MKNNKKTKFHSYSPELGYLFDHDREEVINIFKERYSIFRKLLPFFRKIENESFYLGYTAGYQDGYNEAFDYLLNELGVNKRSGRLHEDIEQIKKYWLENKKSK